MTRTIGFVSALAAGGVSAYAADPPAPPPTPNGAQQVKTKVSVDPILLPTVPVEGKADGYRAEQSSLPRTPKPLVDTPQTIAVVPEQVLDEQRATTVREALRNVSGITMGAGEGGRQGDAFILRGFSAQNDMFRDGSRDLGWFTRDTFNLEGVEVFFGPSAVTFGRGSTGGAINLVTKTPKRGSFAEATLIAATAPQGRVEADVNQAFSPQVQVRVNAMGQMGGVAGRETVEENRGGLAPSVRISLGERTVLGADYLYQRERGVPDYGQPFVDGSPVSVGYGVPRSAFYGVGGSDAEEVDAHVLTGRLEHDFAPSVRLTNALRIGIVDRFARPTAPTQPAPAMNPTTVGRQRFETETDHQNLINQLDLRLAFATWFAKHTANAGLELAREARQQTRHNYQVMGAMGSAANLSADLRNPDPHPDLSTLARMFGNSSDSLLLSGGVYLSDQIQLGQYLELLGSLRLDFFRTTYQTTNAMGALTELEQRDRLVNGRGGLVVHPLSGTSIYATVATSSNPSAEGGTLSDATVTLIPEKNIVTEIGAKADLLDARLSLGGSAFRIDKTNARVPGTDPMGPPQVLAGKQRVQGFNLGAAGTLLDRWKLFGSYTFLSSRIRAHTNEYLVGQALPNAPGHSLSLWTTLTLLDRLVLGGGAAYQAATVINNPTSAMQALNLLPSYWRLDAVASYAWRRAELQLNVANLTNALYYDQSAGSRAVPAEGRVVMVSTRVRY